MVGCLVVLDFKRPFETVLQSTREGVVVVVVLLFYVHGKHLRSYRDGQLT